MNFSEELYAQLVSLVIVRQIYGQFKEVLLPWVGVRCERRCGKYARQDKQLHKTRSNQVLPAGEEATATGMKAALAAEQEAAIKGDEGPVEQSTYKQFVSTSDHQLNLLDGDDNFVIIIPRNILTICVGRRSAGPCDGSL